MSIDNRDQRVDQLLQGIYRLCVNTDDCSSCPFYVTKCTFGEPRPRSWFDEETIEIKAEADPTPVEETETETPLIKAIENAIEAPEEPEPELNFFEQLIADIVSFFNSIIEFFSSFFSFLG